MSARTGPNPFYRRTELLLDELDVVLALGGQLLERRAPSDRRLPARKRHEAYARLGEEVQIGCVLSGQTELLLSGRQSKKHTWETIQHLSVNLIRHADLNLRQRVEDVEFGEVERVIAVDE